MSGPYADNKAAQVGVTITSSILIVTDLIGNSLVVLIIVRNKSMKSPMNYLLVNLAVADMMVGLFLMPRVLKHYYTHPGGLAGTVMCKLLTGSNLAWVGSAVSSLSLVAISIERYFAVVYPYSTKYRLYKLTALRLIVFSWIFSAVLNAPSFVIREYDKISSCKEQWPDKQPWLSRAYGAIWCFFFGLIPVTIMVVLYSRVIYTLWFKRPEHQAQGTQLAMLKSRKRVTKMVVVVSIFYGVFITPNLIMYLVDRLQPVREHDGYDIPYIISNILVICNSTINPFIYTFQNGKFKHHLIKLLCGRKLRRNTIGVREEATKRPSGTLNSNLCLNQVSEQ